MFDSSPHKRSNRHGGDAQSRVREASGRREGTDLETQGTYTMSAWVAIDFETADQQRDSACAVGLVRVESGVIVRREVRLIRPPREVIPEFTAIHGLTPERLAWEVPFRDVWATLAPVLEGVGLIVAHNVPFDRSVLEACCGASGLVPPSLPWACTLSLSRQRWGRGGNRLPDVCGRLGVRMGLHHDAGADAEAAAMVYLALRGGRS